MAEPRFELKEGNMDSYEREKLEVTLGDLELAVKLGRNYLKMIDNADEQGVALKRVTRFDKIRVPGGLACPGGKLGDGVMELQGMFMSGQTELAHQMTQQQAERGGLEK